MPEDFPMLLFPETQVDRYVRHWRASILLGICLLTVAFALPRGSGIGVFTGFMLLSLGVYSFCLRGWRTEPGLWMLAGFLTVFLTPCWAFFEYMHWEYLLSPRIANKKNPVSTWDAFRFSFDAIVALLIFERTIRLCVTVVIRNWKRTRNSVQPRAVR